jgi:hypothetical protein
MTTIIKANPGYYLATYTKAELTGDKHCFELEPIIAWELFSIGKEGATDSVIDARPVTVQGTIHAHLSHMNNPKVVLAPDGRFYTLGGEDSPTSFNTEEEALAECLRVTKGEILAIS